MTFALFLLYVVLLYLHPAQIVPALAPYHVTYWVGMAGLAAAIVSVLGRRDGPVGNLQLWGVIGFTTVMGVSLMIAERWLGAPILTLQRFGPSLTVFVLAMCSVTSMVRLRIAAGCVMVLTTVLMLQGAAAYHLDYNTRLFLLDRATSGDDPTAATAEEAEDGDTLDQVPDNVAAEDEWPTVRRIRALGFMNDPNDLALGMIVALGLIAGAWKPRLHAPDVLLAAAAVTLVYGIYLTRSRGGAVALVVVLWRFAASRIGLLPSFALLAALGAGAMTLDFAGRSLSVELDESASERLLAWTEGLEMLKTEPLLGVGYGQFIDHHTLTAHNSLVLCFAETGLIGCFFWVGLLAVTLLELHRLKTLPGDHPFDAAARRWAQGLQLSLIGFLTGAFFLSRTFVPTLYLVLGLAAALAAIARAANRPVTLPPLPALGLLVFACELAGIGVVYAMVKLHVA
jgi:putative inorganic carbon (HCO3(-)) transporter